MCPSLIVTAIGKSIWNQSLQLFRLDYFWKVSACVFGGTESSLESSCIVKFGFSSFFCRKWSVLHNAERPSTGLRLVPILPAQNVESNLRTVLFLVAQCASVPFATVSHTFLRSLNSCKIINLTLCCTMRLISAPLDEKLFDKLLAMSYSFYSGL